MKVGSTCFNSFHGWSIGEKTEMKLKKKKKIGFSHIGKKNKICRYGIVFSLVNDILYSEA